MYGYYWVASFWLPNHLERWSDCSILTSKVKVCVNRKCSAVQKVSKNGFTQIYRHTHTPSDWNGSLSLLLSCSCSCSSIQFHTYRFSSLWSCHVVLPVTHTIQLQSILILRLLFWVLKRPITAGRTVRDDHATWPEKKTEANRFKSGLACLYF